MLTILTVNSSASTRHMMAFTLKGAGYDVIEAIDGDDALYKAKWSKPDAVLTDANILKMDSITLIQELRKLSNYRHTPMLMLTSGSSYDMKANEKHEGVTGYLNKPLKSEQLLTVIKKIFPDGKEEILSSELPS